MKTNLLFIFTDEQSTNTIGAYGNALINTPHLDALASRSVVFDRCYVTQPVCTASRSSILTGLYPHTNGCTENNLNLDDSTKTIAELVDPGAYRTGYIGKWHLGDEIFAQHGFEEWVSIEDAYRAYYSAGRDRSVRSTYHHYLVDQGYSPDVHSDTGGDAFSRPFAARLPEEHTKAAFVASEACSFLERHADDQFILFVNFLEPHMPFYGPRDRQYADSDIPLPANYDDPLSDKSLKTRMFALGYERHGHSGLELDTRAGWQELTRRYWGLVSMVDAQVGRILECLEKTGADERTVIVFTSDHGDMMSAHRLLGKCVMFEEAIRVPLLVSVPGAIAREREIEPHRVRGLTSQIDLVPTLLDLLEQPAAEQLEGRSLLPALCGTGARPGDEDVGSTDRGDVVVEWNGMNSGFGDVLGDTHILPDWREIADDITIKAALDDPVRTIITADGWKYTWSHRGEDALYQLHTDPGELRNRVSTADSGLIDDLRNRIEHWQTVTLDPVVFG